MYDTKEIEVTETRIVNTGPVIDFNPGTIGPSPDPPWYSYIPGADVAYILSQVLTRQITEREFHYLDGRLASEQDRMEAVARAEITVVGGGAYASIINSNNWLRIGWGGHDNRQVFRISIGAANEKYLNRVPVELQPFNKWLRETFGHFDIWWR